MKITQPSYRQISLFIIVLLSVITQSQAAVIQGVTVNAVSSEYASGATDHRRATNLLNGSGIYGNLHSIQPQGAMWLSSTPVPPAGSYSNEFVTFDLGAVRTLSQMKVWNYNETAANTQRGIQRANISVAGEDQVFTTNLANYFFNRAPGVFSNIVQVIDIGNVPARYVRINVLTNYTVNNADNRVGLSEVMFIDNTVPPTLVSATRNFLNNRVTVQFSEPFLLSSATNLANYSIQSGTNTVTISNATANVFNDRVELQTSTLDSNLVYTLSAQNVRDASNIISIVNSQVTIDPELVLWLKADVGVVDDGSGNVTQWNDQSGFGNNAAALVPPPTITSGAINGKPAIHFDGISQALEIPHNSSLLNYGDISLFMVLSVDTTGTGSHGKGPISKCNANLPSSFDLQLVATTSKPNFVRGNGRANQSFNGATAGLAANQYYIVSATMKGTNVSDYLNGNFNGGANISPPLGDTGNPIRLGVRLDGNAAAKFDGNMAEVLLFRGAASDADQGAINAYLGAKYNISVVTLAITSHPENATRLVGQKATFTVSAIAGTPTLFYQWQKGTANIPGATNATYTTPTLAIGDNNSTYRVIVSTPLGVNTTSSSATLTVLADNESPTISSALRQPGSSSSLVVNFSEAVISSGATLANNYSLNNGATVSSAVMGSSSNQVVLTTSSLDASATYFLTVQNVQDLSTNTMVTTSVVIFPGNLALWIKADAGVLTNSSGLVNEWEDQSGNQNHAQQYGLTGLRPTLVPAAMNNKPALRFDGASNYLQSAHSPSLAIVGDLTIYAVVNITDYAAGRQIIAKTAVNQPASYDYYALSATVTRLYRGNGIGANAVVAGTTSPAAGEPHIMSVTMQGTAVNHYIDGIANGAGVLTTLMADTGAPFRIGSRNDLAQYMKGDIAEILMFSSALSASERQGIDTYLGFKYFPFSITQQPQSTNVLEGQSATFTVSATAGGAVFNYKWQKGTTDIPGATNATYTTPALAQSDSGSTYRAIVLLPDGTTATSDPATVNVSADTELPTVISVGKQIGSQTQIVVVFSEAMTSGSATNISHYSLDNGATIISAVMGDAPNKVILTTSTLNPALPYSLTVHDIQDLFNNTIAPATIPAGVSPVAALWLKADTGVVYDGSGSVSSWVDQSGNFNDANAISGSNPLFITNAFNGKPALRFDGTNNFMAVSPSSSVALDRDMTVYFVASFRDFTNTAFEIGMLGKSIANQPAPYDYYLSKTTGRPRFYRGNGTVNGFNDAVLAPAVGQVQFLSVVAKGQTINQYLNGQTNGSGIISVTPADSSGSALGIGTREDLRPKMNGDVAEILMFGTALSDSERQSIDAYIANKYGILAGPVSLSIQRTGSDVVISWPVAPVTFTLESKADLNSATWSTVTNSVGTSGGLNSVVVSPVGAGQFYRLRNP